MVEQWQFLLIEDDEPKRSQLKAFLETAFPGGDIIEARSLMGGLSLLECGARPSVVLLDMTLPNFDVGPDESGGATHPYGGRELLRELDEQGITVPVIVVTQFATFGSPPNVQTVDDLDKVLSAEHSHNYVGIVSYNSAISGWREALHAKILESEFPL